MSFLKSIHKHIPGFRQLSANSMIIAATYYGAAVLTMVRYWQWGLALLALPFLVFNLLELNRERNRRAALLSAVLAGLVVLFGAAAGVSVGGMPQAMQPAAAVSSVSVLSTAPASARPQATAAVPASASSSAAEQAQFAFVAAKGGKVFHLPGCGSAKRIKPENVIGFQSREEALAAGLQPCKICKP